MKRLFALVIGLTLCLPFSACGGEGSKTLVGDGGTVKVVMSNLKFTPDEFEVKAGDQVRFAFTNNSNLVHDAFIGDQAAQAEHEQAGDMDHAGHGEGAITVDPGKTGELTYTFDKPGKYLIGCHQPGHYGAGMKATITVK